MAHSPESKAPARINELEHRFELDRRRTAVLELRYQLLTLTAAVLVAVERLSADRAVVMVHEFVTPLTSANKRERNVGDLDRFLAEAWNCRRHLSAGRVVGAFTVADAPQLNIGKARTTVLASIPEPTQASNPDRP